jgi:transposase InsO family protein
MNGILMKLLLKSMVLSIGFGLLLTPKLDLFLLFIFLENVLGANALTTLFSAAKHGAPQSIVSDRLPGYTRSTKRALPKSEHIKVQSFSDDISNNLIESFNKTFKAWYKSKLGFKDFNSANNMVFMFIFFYNFINPHSSLSNLSPAQVAGAKYSDKQRQQLLLVS